MRTAIGLAIPFVDGPGVRRVGVRAEELGFDTLAVGEHIMMPTPIPAAFTTLSFLAAVTERVRLLTSVALAPLYPSPLLTKLVTSLDNLSEGRLDLGLGVGGEFPAEFDACGVPVKERGARLNEALEVLRTLGSGATSSFDGRFTSFANAQILPGVHQRPFPPIWIAGRSDAALNRAARSGDVWMPYLITPEQLRDRTGALEQKAAAVGRAGRVSTAVFCWLGVDHDGAAARRRTAEFVGRIYRQDFTGRAGRLLISGTAEQCRAGLRELADAGARSLILCLAHPPGDDMHKIVEMVGQEVIPDFSATT